MSKYVINKSFSAQSYKQTVEAQKYVQEGDYFVFYANGGTRKVLTVASSKVHSIDEVAEGSGE